MADFLLYIVIVWAELTAFVLMMVGAFLFIGYKARVVPILHLLRKPFIHHYLVDSRGFKSHVHVSKDIKQIGKSRFVECKPCDYIYDPSFVFSVGNDVGIANAYGKPAPLKFEPENGILVAQDGEKYADETRAALRTKLMIDFNRSIYQTKDLIMMFAIFGLFAISIVGIYFSFETSQQVAVLNNYLAHYFAQNPPVP